VIDKPLELGGSIGKERKASFILNENRTKR
jgi:hypothetical protein